MKTSEQINELAAALAKAQGDITNADKDKTNPHFQSKYATLASTWDACRAPLSKNGLSVVQVVDGDVLISRLLHSTGQYIESTMGIKPTQNSPQGFGSALTYARRYSLQALVGIAPGDDVGQDDEDDANEGSGIQTEPSAQTGPKPVITPKTQTKNEVPDKNPTQAQVKRLFSIAGASQWTNDQVKEFIGRKWGIDSTSKLTIDQYNEVCTLMPNAKFSDVIALVDTHENFR